MVLLKALSGPAAGSAFVARRFPFRIGHSQDSDLRLEAGGVWQDHGRLEFDKAQSRFLLTAVADALVLVNGERIAESRLRNGDVVEIGSVKLRFGLAPVVQPNMKLREATTWFLLALIVATQALLLTWLIR